MSINPFQVGDVLATRPEPSLVLKKEDEGLLLKMGDQYIWALGVDMDVDENKNWYIVWEQAYYFDEIEIVPELKELTQYDNCTAVLSNSLWYVINDQNCALLSNSSFFHDELPGDEAVIVPPYISCNNQVYEVTGVADWAFYKNQQIINLKLPDSVKNVGKYAFTGAILKNISLSEDTVLSENSFYGCDDLAINRLVREDTTMSGEKFLNIESQKNQKSEFRTFGEFLNSGQELDCELIIGDEEMNVSFVWNADDRITHYGYKQFQDLLDCPYEVLSNGNISINDGNAEQGNCFVSAATGYTSQLETLRIFTKAHESEVDWDHQR